MQLDDLRARARTNFDPGCTAEAHETTATASCDHCGICLRCFGTGVLRLSGSNLIAAAPDSPVKTELVQDLEGVATVGPLVMVLEGGYLVVEDGQTFACFCVRFIS
jgi:hypothetical protein